jgi:hypothetical protein
MGLPQAERLAQSQFVRHRTPHSARTSRDDPRLSTAQKVLHLLIGQIRKKDRCAISGITLYAYFCDIQQYFVDRQHLIGMMRVWAGSAGDFDTVIRCGITVFSWEGIMPNELKLVSVSISEQHPSNWARFLRCGFALMLSNLALVAHSAPTVIWEDQFTAPDANWSIPDGVTFTYQASPASNSEDGFELVFTSTTRDDLYVGYTLPFTKLIAGDKIEWGVRTYWPYSAGATADRVSLEDVVYDSGFTIHDSGNTFTKISQPVEGIMRETSNLYIGTNSAATKVNINVPSVMYFDYVRITREVPEPAALSILGIAAGFAVAVRRNRR